METERCSERSTIAPAEVELEYICCNLCGSSQHELLFKGHDRLMGLPGVFNVVRCRSCGLKFINPRPAQASIGLYYPSEYPSYRRPEPRVRKETGAQFRFIRFLKDVSQKQVPVVSPALRWVRGEPRRRRRWAKHFCPPLLSYRRGCRVLDVGCGTGDFLARAKDLWGCEAHGVDNSAHACAIARAQGLDIFCGQLQEACFPDEFVHIVRLSHVFEHLPNPSGTLKEIRRIIRGDGSVFMAVPNAGGFTARLFGERWRGWEVPRHFYGFGRETLRILAQQAGFDVIRAWTAWQRVLSQRLCGSSGAEAIGDVVKSICYLVSPWLGDDLRVILRPSGNSRDERTTGIRGCRLS